MIKILQKMISNFINLVMNINKNKYKYLTSKLFKYII